MKIPESSLESKEPFADAAGAYKDAGLAPIPCNDKAANCVRWKKKPPQPGPNLVAKFSDKNIGILTGKRSGVFIVDVDDPDQFDDMEARFGPTLIVTATASGHRHYWYRWNGEPKAKLPNVDLLGEGGFAVCPPSFRREEGEHQGNRYYFIRGGLEDVDLLDAILPGSFPQQCSSKSAKSARVAASRPPIPAGEKTREESRNFRLFMAVKDMAFTLGADDLAAYAHDYNVTEFKAHPKGPKDAAEVDKVVASVLGYGDKLMRRGSGPCNITGLDEILDLAAYPRASVLWNYLRLNNQIRKGPIVISPEAIADVFVWSAKTVRAARNDLIKLEYVRKISDGKRTRLTDGTWKIAPHQYELSPNKLAAARNSSRSVISTDNTTIHLLSASAPCNVVSISSYLQGEIFGADLKVSGAILDGWDHGIMPLEVRRAMKTKIRADCLTQDEVAALVGLSRPQLTNGLNGVFGFGPDAAAKLKAFLEAA